ncbi:MAG: TonB-dependent receptor [Bacteroidales bacterium]|nr:TonB-dependent receptor [Bacteroidales bacterium]
MKYNYLTIAAACLMGAAVPCHARAEAKAVASEYSDTLNRVFELNPVVVTGNGHRQQLKSSTTPVHVISKNMLKETGLTDFHDAMSRLMPQVSFSPSTMGSYLRLNGLGNKYVLVLVNGKKLIGDISGNIDLGRINVGSIRRIEVLDGAASSLYGSDAIGGVINIITDQPTDQLISVTTNSRVSGKGQWTQAANVDISAKGFGSHTAFSHDAADSYQNNRYTIDSKTGEAVETIDPLFVGFTSNVASQRFTYDLRDKLSLFAGGAYSWRRTQRPEPVEGIVGGSAYDMRSEGWRWEAGGKYRFNRHTLQLDFVADDYAYGNIYDTPSGNYKQGDYVKSKNQKYYEGELKGIFNLYGSATTIVGVDYRNDFLVATAGDVDNHAFTWAAYAQHDTRLWRNLSATIGLRYTRHQAFGNNFTPKVALMYAPGNLRIRAAFSQGFRAPGLDELYYHYFKIMAGRPVITFGNKALKAEKSNYASLSAEYSNRTFSVMVMGYLNFIDDMIIKEKHTVDDAIRAQLLQEFPEMTPAQAEKLSSYNHYVNSDKGAVKGIQVNASVNIVDGLSATGSYAFTHARTKTAAGEWQNLERSVRHSGTLALNYNQTWQRYTLNLNLNGRVQSKTYYPDYEDAPGYGIWSLNSTHTFDVSRHLSIMPSLGVENIFNKKDTRIDHDTIRHALYSPGRMLVVGLKLHFKG